MRNFRRARDLLVLALCTLCLLLAVASLFAPAILAVNTGPPGLELVSHPAAMSPAIVAPIGVAAEAITFYDLTFGPIARYESSRSGVSRRTWAFLLLDNHALSWTAAPPHPLLC